MDLPDHDSTEVSHHLEVDRLVELADLLVWVLDPQKYADAALHDRYLAPLRDPRRRHAGRPQPHRHHRPGEAAGHGGRRQATARERRARVGQGDPDQCPRGHRRRRAPPGDRVPRRAEAQHDRARRSRCRCRGRHDSTGPAATRRPARSPTSARMPSTTGSPRQPVCRRRRRRRADRPEPGRPSRGLAAGRRDRGLGRRGADEMLAGYRAGSQPQAVAVQRAAVDNGVRDARRRDRPRPRRAVGRRRPRRRDRAARGDRRRARPRADARVDLRADRLPGWVGLVRVLQWLLFLGAVGGGVWWAVLAFQGTLDDAPEVAGLPAAADRAGRRAGRSGCCCGWSFRPLVGGAARARGDDADRALREVVADVLAKQVVAPTNGVLASYAAFRSGIANARVARPSARSAELGHQSSTGRRPAGPLHRSRSPTRPSVGGPAWTPSRPVASATGDIGGRT